MYGFVVKLPLSCTVASTMFYLATYSNINVSISYAVIENHPCKIQIMLFYVKLGALGLTLGEFTLKSLFYSKASQMNNEIN